jgi:hypothetical protein
MKTILILAFLWGCWAPFVVPYCFSMRNPLRSIAKRYSVFLFLSMANLIAISATQPLIQGWKTFGVWAITGVTTIGVLSLFFSRLSDTPFISYFPYGKQDDDV